MKQQTPQTFTSIARLVQQANGQDVAALAFGTWQLLANLQQRAGRSPQLTGIGARIDLAALRWSSLQQAVDAACTDDAQKALIVAEQFALSPLRHFQDWAARLQTQAADPNLHGSSHEPAPR